MKKKMDKIMDQIIDRRHNNKMYSLHFSMFSFLQLLVEVRAQHFALGLNINLGLRQELNTSNRQLNTCIFISFQKPSVQ